MRSTYITHWKSSLGTVGDNKGKLYLYRRIKNEFVAEPYLKQIVKGKNRRAMTCLRISAHRLEIETGRHASKNKGPIERERRLCTLCQQNKINSLGDEQHALMTCPSFEPRRRELLTFLSNRCPNFQLLNDFDKMLYMLTCEDDSAQKVGKFVHEILTTQRPKLN